MNANTGAPPKNPDPDPFHIAAIEMVCRELTNAAVGSYLRLPTEERFTVIFGALNEMIPKLDDLLSGRTPPSVQCRPPFVDCGRSKCCIPVATLGEFLR